MSETIDILINENFCEVLYDQKLDIVLESVSEGVEITRYLN